MIQWRTFGAAALLLVSTAASRLSSAGISSRLVYSRAEAAAICADEAKLRAAVAERLGYDPFVAHATTTVVAEIVREGSTFRARAHLVDGSGIARGWRELSSQTDDCRPVVAALALAISIALDPMSAVAPSLKTDTSSADAAAQATTGQTADAPHERPKTRTPESDAAPKESAAGSVPVTPGDRDRSTSRSPNRAPGDEELRGLVRSGAFLSTGALPTTSAGASLQAALLGGNRWSLGFEAAALLPQGRNASSGDGRVEAWTWTASMVPCLRVRLAALCGLASLGQLIASGQNVAAPGQRTAFFASLGGRAAVEWTLAEAFAVEFYADLLAPLARHSLALNGNDVWRAPVVAGALGSAIVFRPR